MPECADYLTDGPETSLIFVAVVMLWILRSVLILGECLAQR